MTTRHRQSLAVDPSGVVSGPALEQEALEAALEYARDQAVAEGWETLGWDPDPEVLP